MSARSTLASRVHLAADVELNGCSARVLTTAACSAAIAAVMMVGCTSTSISSTAPTSQKCQVSASASPTQFGASGGSGALTINAARDCTWTVAPQAGWVSLSAGNSGSGDAVLPYTVAGNVATTSRSAALLVNDSPVALTQAAAACAFALSAAAGSTTAAGGTVEFGINTATGCAWSATVDSSWLAVASAASGSGPATVRVSVTANAGAARTGTVIAGGQSYRLSQDAAAVAPPVPPPSPPPPPPSPPPPSPPPPITLSGVIQAVSGTCPRLAFTLGAYRVTTESTTTYRQGKCTDVSDRDTLSVDGTLSSATTVAATQISVTKNVH